MTKPADAEFDQYAGDYKGLVDASIRISGETAEHFARERIRFLRRTLDRLGEARSHVLDYGCGVGLAAPLMRSELGADRVTGVDISADSIATASVQATDGATFRTVADHRPAGDCDVCYSSGVFHHIVPADRPAAMAVIRDSLRPGGVMALCEHNPFNPGTRWAMYNCVFDADAQTLTARVGRRLMRDNGFDVLMTRYLFIFPQMLKALRPLEPLVSALPIGAQYVVLARKL